MGLGDAAVSFWVKFDNDVAQQYEDLVVCGGGAVNQPGYRLTRFSGASGLYCWFGDGVGFSSTYLTPTTILTGNVWHHIVVVFDRDVSAQAYINGVKQAQSFNISSRTTNIVNAHSYRIGGISSSADTRHLDGTMDDVRVYNAAIPSSQIRENYLAGLNKLLANNAITQTEYDQRLVELNSNVAEK